MGRHPSVFVGDVFARLTIIEMLPITHAGAPRRCVCTCECGREVTPLLQNVRRGLTTSCGCALKKHLRERNTSHGMYGTPAYWSWQSMLGRCNRPTNPGYEYYGAKGVTVCPEWDTFERFFADMGERPEGTSLDRINPWGNYEPSNCRWADAKTQANNKRRHHPQPC